MKNSTLSVLALSLLVAQGAVAGGLDNSPANDHKGFYAEVNAGTNFVYATLVSSEKSERTATHNGTGWNANLGYQFNRYVGLEGGFMQNRAKIHDDEFDVTVHSRVDVPYAAARFTAPIGKRFALIGKVGGMYARVRDTDTNSPDVAKEGGSMALPYVGVGASYSLNKHVDLNVQYQGAVYGIAGAGLLGGGVTIHL